MNELSISRSGSVPAWGGIRELIRGRVGQVREVMDSLGERTIIKARRVSVDAWRDG